MALTMKRPDVTVASASIKREKRSLADFLGALPVIEFPSRTILFRQEEQADCAYWVSSGIVKLQYVNPAGKEVIIDLRHPGCLLGTAAIVLVRCHAMTAETLTPSRLARIPAPQFRDTLKSDSRFSTFVHRRLAQELENHLSKLIEHTSYSSRHRLLRLLRGVAADVAIGPSQSVLVPLKQWEIAELLAVTPEHISRMLRRLEEEGLVRRKKNLLVISDAHRLGSLDLAQDRC